MNVIGREFLRHYYLSLAKDLTRDRLHSCHRYSVFLGVSRTASEVSRRARQRVAIGYGKRALREATDALTKAVAIHSVGELLAKSRSAADLSLARRYLVRAEVQLSSVADTEQKLRIGVKIANAQALVSYRQGKGGESLQYQLRVRGLVDAFKTEYPGVARWASVLANNNVARIMINQFGDYETAVSALEDNVRLSDDPIGREQAKLALARLYFDRSDFPKVADLLSDLYAQGAPALYDEHREVAGRSMIAIAFMLGGRYREAAAQADRLAYLGTVNDMPGAVELARILLEEARAHPKPSIGRG